MSTAPAADRAGEELVLPKASLTRILKETLPPGAKANPEALELLNQCCTEFLQLVSSEANAVCEREKKQIISPDHVLTALKGLGFEGLLEELHEFWGVVKASNRERSERKQNSRKAAAAGVSGLSEAEQIALQQRLFAEARSELE